MSPTPPLSRTSSTNFTRLLGVPQPRWQPRGLPSEDVDTLHPFPPILFNHLNSKTGQVTPGVPLVYVAAQGESANLSHLIQNASDKVFREAHRAYFRLLWPGYDHVEFVTSIPLKTVAGRITRGQLAQFLTKAIQQCFSTLQASSGHASHKAWAVGSGSGNWAWEDVVLVALHLIHGNTFQAELRVDAKASASV